MVITVQTSTKELLGSVNCNVAIKKPKMIMVALAHSKHCITFIKGGAHAYTPFGEKLEAGTYTPVLVATMCSIADYHMCLSTSQQ